MTDQNKLSEEASHRLDATTPHQVTPASPSSPDDATFDQIGSDASLKAFDDNASDSDAARIDPTEYIDSNGFSSSFDELLRAFEADQTNDIDDQDDEGFGTLKESQIAKGVTGLVSPELGDDTLASEEIAFGVSAGELQAIIKTLSLMLRLQPEGRRRCRIVVNGEGVTWHANQANGFIEYFTAGSPTNLKDGSSRTVIVALSDLRAAARGTREVATFRIKHETIRFTAHRFERPILVHSARSFPIHTDRLLLGVDLSNYRPEVASPTIGAALAFLGTIVPSEIEDHRLSVIQIQGAIARATRTSIAAQVETSTLDGLDIGFRPHFLRWLLPALKLRANFQIWHSDKFCVFKNEHLTFGFELVPDELPKLPSFKITDTLRTPARSFITFLERAIGMLGPTARVTLLSDERGKSPLTLRADDDGQTSRGIETTFDAYREGEAHGSITIVCDALLLLKAMRVSSDDANVEVSIAKNALFLESKRDDVTSSVIVTAKVKS